MLNKKTRCIIACCNDENETEELVDQLYETLLEKKIREFKNSRTEVITTVITDNVSSLKVAKLLVQNASEYSPNFDGIVLVKGSEVLLAHMSETHVELFDQFINETCKDAIIVLIFDEDTNKRDIEAIKELTNIKGDNVCTMNIFHQRKKL